MNRSILIVICDFLLLSLLTFSTDINQMAGDTAKPPTRAEVATNEPAATANNDLAAAMKLALEEEQRGRQQLQQQLAASQNNTSERESQLSQREQENAKLQQQISAAQASLTAMNAQLQSNAAAAQAAQAQYLALQAQSKDQSDLANQLQRQLNQLAQSNQMILADKQKLSGQLQVAEVEKRAATEQVGLMQQEVQAQRAENSRLSETFKALATNSTQLAQEIRDNREMAPNAIFSQFATNRIVVSMVADRAGFLGIDANKDRLAQSVLATDGTNTYAVFHVQDSPLALRDPGTDWDSLAGTLSGTGQVLIRALSFHKQDPRVVLVQLTPDEVRQIGRKPYAISSDPYKFQDAVLVGADQGYYGECNFQIDLETPGYVHLDRNLIKGLFGKFNPSRGDLVFSRTGQLLGIMVNSSYCLTLRNFAAVASLAFGDNLKSEHTGDTLAQLYDYVFDLPMKLQ